MPEIVVIPVFADDAAEAAQGYAADLDAYFARAAPGTIVVVVTRYGLRPATLKALWTPPRAWLPPGA